MGFGLFREGFFCCNTQKASTVTRLTVGVPNDLQMERNLTGGILRPLDKPRSIPRTFDTRTQKKTRGVRRRRWERRIAKRTTGKMLGCMRRTCRGIVTVDVLKLGLSHGAIAARKLEGVKRDKEHEGLYWFDPLR